MVAASKRVGIHPSAGRALKEWGASKFSALADALAGRADVDVLITGSAGDRAMVERVVSSAKSTPKTLIDTDLMTFAAAVELFDVLVTGE